MTPDTPLQLYTYFRSSAAHRVRIALALKQLDYTSVLVHLLKEGGHQLLPAYRAIIEYLDERYPEPALLPATGCCAHVRARSPCRLHATSIQLTTCAC